MARIPSGLEVNQTPSRASVPSLNASLARKMSFRLLHVGGSVAARVCVKSPVLYRIDRVIVLVHREASWTTFGASAAIS